MKTIELTPEKAENTAAALLQLRLQHNSSRFLQLNNLLIGHSEGSLQYLLAVNGGGCIAMLGLVGAAEKWRIQNWPYPVLAVFVIGLIVAGIARAAILIQAQYLVTGWVNDTSAYFGNNLEWRVVTANDAQRVRNLRWLPWACGATSLLCFIGGAVAAGYLFFTLR